MTTLTVFAHREGGSSAAVAMLRGLILGLFGWLAFYSVLLTSLPALGVGAFGGAILAALAVQAVSLRVLRSAPIPGEAARLSDGGGSGGDEGTRTPDLRDANAVLSQLSYIPTGSGRARERRTGPEV